MEVRHINIDQLAQETGFSRGSIGTIIGDELHMSEDTQKWVPRTLTGITKQNRVDCAIENLALINIDTADFIVD